MGHYELWYCDPFGNRIASIQDVAAFEYVMTVGAAGYFNCELPMIGQVYTRARPYYRIHVYRQSEGGMMDLEMHAFLRRFVYSTDDDGIEMAQLQGGDGTSLLDHRIVAYRANSAASASSTDTVDKRMSDLMGVTFGSGAIFDYDGGLDPRTLDQFGFEVLDDRSVGPVVNDAAAWKNMLAALMNLQAKSKTAGTEVFFGVVPLTDTTMQWQYWIDQPGQDRSLAGASPIVVSLANGSLQQPVLDLDFTNMITRVYAGGQGQDVPNLSDRIVEVAVDEELEGISPFARKEQFYNATRYSTSASVQDAADEQLALKRPQRKFTGIISATAQTPYGGNGWHLGDLVTVDYMDYQFQCMVRSVKVQVGRDGLERVSGRLESRDVEVFI